MTVAPGEVRKQKLLRKQAEIIACKKKMAGARGGQSSGKTFAFAWWFLDRVLDAPRGTHVVAGADYGQLRQGFFDTLISILDDFDIRYHYRQMPSPRIRLLDVGGNIHSVSAEIKGKLRSRGLDTVLCEEPQTWDGGEAFFQDLVGRMRGSPTAARMYPNLQPQLRLSFNPTNVGKGHWLYNVIELQWPKMGYPCWQFSVRDNVLLPRRLEYIADLENVLTAEQIPVEVDGEWATVSTGVYAGFDPDIHGTHPDPRLPRLDTIDENRALCWTFDFNVEWMASVVCQIWNQPIVTKAIKPAKSYAQPWPEQEKGPLIDGWQPMIVYALEEIFLKDRGVPDVLDYFMMKFGEIARRTGLVIYGDPSGQARSQSISSEQSARSNWAMILERVRYEKIPYQFRVTTSPPGVWNRVNAHREQFRSGPDDHRQYGFLVNLAKCPNLVLDYMNVKWDPAKNTIDKRDQSDEGRKRTHLSDAMGYMIWVERELQKRGPRAVEFITTL